MSLMSYPRVVLTSIFIDSSFILVMSSFWSMVVVVFRNGSHASYCERMPSIMSGGNFPLFVEYLDSMSPLWPAMNCRYGWLILPLDSAMMNCVSA